VLIINTVKGETSQENSGFQGLGLKKILHLKKILNLKKYQTGMAVFCFTV
jgi:hypothetical protein